MVCRQSQANGRPTYRARNSPTTRNSFPSNRTGRTTTKLHTQETGATITYRQSQASARPSFRARNRPTITSNSHNNRNGRTITTAITQIGQRIHGDCSGTSWVTSLTVVSPVNPRTVTGVSRIIREPADPYGRTMKSKGIAAIGVLLVGLLVSATAPAQASPSAMTIPKPATARGELLSVTPVASLDRAELAAVFRDTQLNVPEPRYAVKAYRIEYRTIDVHAAPTTASALVALPVHRPGRADTVAWEHGTRVGRADVASVSSDNLDRPASLLFAGNGFVTVAPDYLGLGTGPGSHPYTNTATERSASLDALHAGRHLALLRGQALSSDVLISGFSQGGHAAMALGPAVEHTRGLRLKALAPISGPYNLAGTELPALFDGRVDPYIGPFYLAYWTLSSNSIYGLYGSASEVFQPPYDRTLPALFDGSHDESAIIATLPATADQLITAQYAARLRHPEGALRQAIQENDKTCQWRPRVPVRLYAATGDRQVPIGNSEQCVRDLRAAGADPTLVNLGDVDHMDSPVAALPDVVTWFLRQGK
jgi:hypothetical protein